MGNYLKMTDKRRVLALLELSGRIARSPECPPM
jgi:hypothetical protein